MDNFYYCVLRFSKLLSKVAVILIVLILVAVYFITLHPTKLRPGGDDTLDIATFSDQDVRLSRITNRLERGLQVIHRAADTEVATSEVKSANSNSNYLLSIDPDIAKRGKWQRKQMMEFCQKHGMEHFISDDLHEYMHLLYDDSKKIIFCYVPKVGCSKWKYTFLLLNGIISFTEKRLPESTLKKTKRLSDLPAIERKRRLVDYYKYAFVRNPMERIVSAYRNKIARPLNYSLIGSKFEEAYKMKILKTLKPAEFATWLKNSRKGSMYPTFSEFVQYLTMENLKKVNEHFQPVIYLCHPCAINYNFYGNFKLLPQDADTLLSQFKLNSSYYDNESYISHKLFNTSDLVPKYFTELTSSQKEALFYTYADELDFYYSLYPEEKDSHLNL